MIVLTILVSFGLLELGSEESLEFFFVFDVLIIFGGFWNITDMGFRGKGKGQ